MAAKFELYEDKAGECRFRLKTPNGQNILSSEGYSSKSAAMNGIESVQKNASDRPRFEIKESKSGKPYFVLKAANHQVIGQSEMYESKVACGSGLASVMNHAPNATIDDKT